MEQEQHTKVTISFNKSYIFYGLIAIAVFLVGWLASLLFHGAFGSAPSLTQTPAPLPQTQDTIPPPPVPPVFSITVDSTDSDMKVATLSSFGISFKYLAYAYHTGEDYIGVDRSKSTPDPVLSNGKLTFANGFLEMKKKDGALPLEQSVKADFLLGTTGCTAKKIYPSDNDAFYGAQPGMTFVRIYSKALADCPMPYATSDISATFFMFDKHPDTYFFVTGSNNADPSLHAKDGSPFFTKIEFLK